MNLRNLQRKFEDDPKFQIAFNKFFTYAWLVNIPTAVAVFIMAPGFWNKYSVLYILVVSLYANFATNYGALSASEASEAADEASAIKNCDSLLCPHHSEVAPAQGT